MRPIFATVQHSDAGGECTQALATEGLAPSIDTIGQAHDNVAVETVMGLFKNEAVAKASPFRTGALATESDVVDVVVG